MIVDILTKFNNKRKFWLTPEHPLSRKDKDYKLYYSAAVVMQAEMKKDVSPLENFELERLVKAGFSLEASDVVTVLRMARDQSHVIDYLLEKLQERQEKMLLLLDIINVSFVDGMCSKEERSSIDLFARMLAVPSDIVELLIQFIEAAQAEDAGAGRALLGDIEKKTDLPPENLKYYLLKLWEQTECSQAMLDANGHQRIVGRCVITEDLVLRSGMRLIFDHAVVRVFGNISLEGGVLILNNSKLIRKSGSHRACINIRHEDSIVKASHCEVDCRNCGMFIRAEEGRVMIMATNITQTTRGAAVRFWGRELFLAEVTFTECYSPEDGGAVMIHGGKSVVQDCRFIQCEAKRGGAVYAVEGTQVSRCSFTKCNVAEYGAAIYYSGWIGSNVHHLSFDDCHPSSCQVVKYITKRGELRVDKECRLNVSTIADCPIFVAPSGRLLVENANLYLNYPIHCKGVLQLKNVRVVANHLEKGDMIYLDDARECQIYHCEIDGMLKTGGINIQGTRIQVFKSLFRNMGTGRAIFNAYFPVIRDCVFNFCQKGGIYCQGGEIERCVFINCRAKNGAGIQIFGSRGTISQCNFKRCVSDYSKGAVDKTARQQVLHCLFEECDDK